MVEKNIKIQNSELKDSYNFGELVSILQNYKANNITYPALYFGLRYGKFLKDKNNNINITQLCVQAGIGKSASVEVLKGMALHEE